MPPTHPPSKPPQLPPKKINTNSLTEAALTRVAEELRASVEQVKAIPPGRERRGRHDDITVVVLFFEETRRVGGVWCCGLVLFGLDCVLGEWVGGCCVVVCFGLDWGSGLRRRGGWVLGFWFVLDCVGGVGGGSMHRTRTHFLFYFIHNVIAHTRTHTYFIHSTTSSHTRISYSILFAHT